MSKSKQELISEAESFVHDVCIRKEGDGNSEEQLMDACKIISKLIDEIQNPPEKVKSLEVDLDIVKTLHVSASQDHTNVAEENENLRAIIQKRIKDKCCPGGYLLLERELKKLDA